MSFFRVLFLQLFVLGVVGAVAWAIYTFGRLPIAEYFLKEDFENTYYLALKPRHASSCVYFDPDVGDESGLWGYQLRFIDRHNYHIEAVCISSRVGPFLVKKGKLFGNVEKLEGVGVLIPIPIPKDLSGRVVIRAGKYASQVGYDQGALGRVDRTSNFSTGQDIPLTTCEGWNYRCCDTVLETGFQPVEAQVLNCPGSCYQSCNKRPSVVFFNTNPPLNPQRTLEFRSEREEIVFGFEVKDYDGSVSQVVLDFGDGTKLDGAFGMQTVSHGYACSLKQCLFVAKLEAYDNVGVPLVPSPLREVRIILTP